jgi:hypothetical protein
MKSSPKAISAGLLLSFLIVMFVIYGICITYAKSNTDKAIEHYANTQNLPLAAVNDNNKSCSRQLGFTKFVDAAFKASDRSIASSYASNGSCPVDLSQPYLSPDMSIIEENTFVYVLKSLCLNIKYRSISPSYNSETVNVLFRNKKDSFDDSLTLLYFFLANPIYVEFETSDAYAPDYNAHALTKMNMKGFYLTNYSGGDILRDSPDDDINVAFKRLVPQNTNLSNPTFNYTLNGKKVPNLENLIATKSDGNINMKVYFLDDQCPPTAGRSLSIPYITANRVSTIKIFNKNYANDIDVYRDEFYFHQKIFILLQNSKFPVMTFSYEINCTKDKLKTSGSNMVEIYKAYMDNNMGSYGSSLWYVQPIDGVNNMNIFSSFVYTYADSKNFLLRFDTGSNDSGKELAFNNDSGLALELPIAALHERIKVTVTITPSEKIALCKWAADGKDYYVYKRTATCSTSNQFAKLFSQPINSPKNIGDIYVKYDTMFVTNSYTVKLGYTNYLDLYMDKH